MDNGRVDTQRVIKHLPGLFLILEPRPPWTIVAASDDYLRVTRSPPDIVGRALFDVFPDNPHDPGASGVADLTASLARVAASGARHEMATLRYDVRMPASEGGGYQERYWTPVNAPLLGDDGRVEYVIHRVQDATAKASRKATEILESIGEGFITFDRQWRFDFVNSEAYRAMGREPGTISGHVLWDLYPDLADGEFGRNYRHTMVHREKTTFTAFSEARQRWYEVTAAPAAEGICVHFRDVTERKNAEAESARQAAESERMRAMYETTLDSTPDFFYVFDLEHRAIYANEALRRVWGVDDVRGKVWMELGYEQWHADLHDREIDQVIATKAPIHSEIPFTGTNGTRVYDYIFAPVFDAGGEVVAIAGVTRDVTERQAAEQSVREQATRLAESDRAKDEFLATLSHELRNPLAPLRNALTLLMREPRDAALVPVHAMMSRQVNYLVRLVDDLLELSRISRGTLSLRNERVEVAAVVRNALETSEPLIQSRHHRLDVDIAPQAIWLDGDPVRLGQIVSNLLDNAAKYTEDGGRIEVRAWQEGDEAVVSVRDNGPGIEPDALPRMFEMFSRGDRDRARMQGGLGIGLALSRRLAQMHGGSLEARSDGVGRGSEFVVRLPVSRAVEAPLLSPPAGDADLAGVRVLVVDDNHDAGDSLCMLLELLGAEVHVARNGADGIDAFARHRPAAVLLDIGMPGMNGYEVARALRDGYPGGATMLVALTGWGQEEDRRRAREAGFDYHLVKPALIETLQPLLATLKPPALAAT